MASPKTVLTARLAETSETRAGMVESRAWTAAFWRLVSQPRFKRALFLVSDLAAVTTAHHLAETLTLRFLGVSLWFLNPPHYYLFYVPFFAAIMHFFEAYKNPDLRRPEKELELIFKGV